MSDKSAEVLSPAPSHYVGIGASAGGIEAIETFFKFMPPNSGLAFIIIQHLSPTHKSLMAELLSKRTAMAVHRAEDGMPIEANNVYLIPPNRNLRIFHGKLLLSEQDRGAGINLPIDIFFRSLAEDQGDRAIAIVLSGTGSDGTRGIRAIKEEIGVVMVQSVETAAFDGMPRSAIATGLVDFVLAPDEMPAQLLSYTRHPYVAKPEASRALLSDEDGLTRIFALLRERTKVDFTYYKPSTLARRIERRMSVNQLDDLREYVRYLEDAPGEINHLYRDLLIGVTSFFRDPAAYEPLIASYLPALLSGGVQDQVRCWVAGCSTGEEAYSIAIAFCEATEQLGISADIKIFATDVDRDAIVHASSGSYPGSIAADVDPELLSKYFYRKNDGFQIARPIREMVVFAQHNLLKDPPFTNIHFISCRNLLIYLQPVLQKRVLDLFNFALVPDGLLFLGSSETTGDLSECFDPLNIKWRIYRSKGKRRQPLLTEQAAGFTARSMRIPGRLHRGLGAFSPQEEERMLERLLAGLTDQKALPFCMLINEVQELIHVAGASDPYLRFPQGKVINDVSKLIHPALAIPLTTGVQKVLKNNEEVTYTNIRMDLPSGPSTVRLRVLPLPGRRGQSQLLAVLIESTRIEAPVDAEPSELTYDVGKEAQQRIVDLEQELQFTRENLQATVEELETSNEELQATNEELLASNEELQSTNEELQSVNEELHTVNSEHQTKITELTEVNNDLDNLLKSTHLAILFLDENLDMRRFTPEVSKLFRVISQDIGRPFSHVAHRLQNVDPVEFVRRVEEQGSPVEHEVEDDQGNAYLMRVFPYQVAPEVYAGVVLSFVNINQTKTMQKALAATEVQNRLAREAAGLGSWEWDLSSDRVNWSEEIHDIFGISPTQFGGTHRDYLSMVHPEDRDRVERALNRCATRGEPYRVEHRVRRPDGLTRWVAQSGDVQRDSSGRAVALRGLTQDVTNRVAMTRDLELRERRLSSLLDGMVDGHVLIDEDGTILEVNPALEKILGHDRQALLNQPVAKLVPQPHREQHTDYIKAYLDSGVSQVVGTGREVDAVHRNGQPVRVHLTVSRFSVNNQMYFSGIIRRVQPDHEA